jgi:hypothetical protein
MQPYWSLNFPSMEALDESQLLHSRMEQALDPTNNVPSRTPQESERFGAIRSLYEVASHWLLTGEAPSYLSGEQYAEVITEHFARSAYIS